MELRRLHADEAAVRRYVEDLWLPYQRELERTVERHALADGVDIVAEEVAFRRERLRGDEYRTWVAVDPPAGAESAPASLADAEGTLAGFVTTGVDAAPPVFDRPDRLVVGDLYVRERYRGTGLAETLVDRAGARADAAGCGQLVLDVDVDNERAVAFYERLGFTTYRRRLVADADAV